MHIYAIGDLHLPGGQAKPMDVFGGKWRDHAAQIESNWKRIVRDGDVVLVPGDISWAMKLHEAAEDLAYVGRLPGSVVLSKGNHDYWWQAIGKVRSALGDGVRALQNDHLPLGDGWAICGSRGWNHPYAATFTAEDQKLYGRELQRFELSLKSAVNAGLKPAVAMLHFPPAPADGRPTGFTDLLERYRVPVCVYGHLHGDAQRGALSGTLRGVVYHLVACDAIGFTPKWVAELSNGDLRTLPAHPE